jgi:biofilm PGA synthesis protein PgaD
MGQSGPGHPGMILKSPIIARPDLQSSQQRTLYRALTLVFWIFWLYLWLPLLALLAWSVGLQQAYKYMIVLGGYQEVLRLLIIYSLVILLLGGTLTGWATYNILRYGKRPRRSGGRLPTSDEVARYFRQGPIAIESWQQAQKLLVTHDEEGGIASVEIIDQIKDSRISIDSH